MRRPLFETGLPQVVPSASALTILDLRSLSAVLQSYPRFVTLYAANQTVGSQDRLTVSWQEGSNAPVTVMNASRLPTGMLFGGPIMLLDRFPLQGNVRLTIQADALDVPIVWGYFELGVSGSIDRTERPLQPGALVPPFNYEPVSIATAEPEETVHLFDSGYYDLILLDVLAQGAEGIANITVSDGANTTVIEMSGSAGQLPFRLFDGIPMQAAAMQSVTPGIVADVGLADLLATWGSFTRVS